MKPVFRSYLDYYATLTPENVDVLRTLAAPDLHFVDPFNDVRDVEHVVSIFKKMFRKLKEPKFHILTALEDQDVLFVKWRMEFRTPLVKRGRKHEIEGISVIKSEAPEKITEHIDYWDSNSQLLTHLPIVGSLFKVIRRYFA